MRLFFPSAHTLPAPPPHAPPWVTHMLNLRRRRQWQPPSTELPALAPPLRLRSRAPQNQSTTASFAALMTNQRRCHHLRFTPEPSPYRPPWLGHTSTMETQPLAFATKIASAAPQASHSSSCASHQGLESASQNPTTVLPTVTEPQASHSSLFSVSLFWNLDFWVLRREGLVCYENVGAVANNGG